MSVNNMSEDIEVGQITARLQCRYCMFNPEWSGGKKTIFFSFNPKKKNFSIPMTEIERFNAHTHTPGLEKCSSGYEIEGLEITYLGLNVRGLSEEINKISVKGLVFEKVRDGRFKCVFNTPQDISLFV